MRVGAFRIDAGALLVEAADGQTTRLTPKAMGVLLALAREPGVTLSRDELLDQVWGSVHVTPGVVGHAITALRRAFGDDLERPGYIETIPRIGYRLVAPVQVLAGVEAALASQDDAGPGGAGAQGGVRGEKPADAAAPLLSHASGDRAETHAASPTRGPAHRRLRRLQEVLPLAAIAIALGLAVLAVVAWRLSPQQSRSRTVPAPAAEPARRVTFAPGSEAAPRLNPGGDWLVYTRRERLDDPPRLFLQSLYGTEPIALADGDHAERPAWSPDGREVAYVWRATDGSGCEIRATGIDGVGHVKIADCPSHSVVYLDWNPADADQIAYSAVIPGSPGGSRIRLLRRGQGWALERFDYESSTTAADLYPRFSPDGRRIAFRRGSNPTSDLYSVPTTGGEVTRLTVLRSEISGFDWLPDGSGLVFSSNHEGDRALYTLELATGGIAALGIHDASSPDVGHRNWNLAFQLEAWQSALAEYPLDGAPRRLLAPSSGRDFSAAMSNDGTRVVFASDRDGSSQLWLLGRQDGKTSRLTQHGAGRVEAPVLSADGGRVLYVLRVAGRHELHEFDLEQGVSHQVSVAGASLRNAVYGGDDRSVWYTAWHEDGWRLHACRRGPATTRCEGRPTPLPAFRVERASLQGGSALLLADGSDHGRVTVVAEDDLRPLPVAAFAVEEPWRVVGDTVWTLQADGAGSFALVEHALQDGSRRRVATLHGLRLLLGESFQVSADHRHLVLPVVTENRTDIGVSRLRPGAG